MVLETSLKEFASSYFHVGSTFNLFLIIMSVHKSPEEEGRGTNKKKRVGGTQPQAFKFRV